MDWIRVGKKNPRYFEFSNGKTFVPVGVNLCFQRFLTTDEECLEAYRHQMETFAANGGNFLRIWMGVPFLQLEPERADVFSDRKLDNLHALIEIAKKNHLRIKFTLEHFRRLDKGADNELFPGAANFQNPVYRKENGGFADSVTEFMTSPEGRKHFIRKLELLSRHFAGEPTIAAWELWNEINTLNAPETVWKEWSELMLQELHRCFPHQMCLQNLGSFDSFVHQSRYDWLCTLPGCDFSQAHRYLDPGADLDICRGPMDLLCGDAIRELREKNPLRPAILAETGAVEWKHCRASHLYELDSQGMLLHDGIFAPFFSGSAGCGQFWHWDQLYLERHNLWWHFARFVRATEGFDPAEEDARPFFRDSRRLRIYGLQGRSTVLVWLRDKLNTWQNELDRRYAPERLNGLKLNLRNFSCGDFRTCSWYSPWTEESGNLEIRESEIQLPAFERSLVLRLGF